VTPGLFRCEKPKVGETPAMTEEGGPKRRALVAIATIFACVVTGATVFVLWPGNQRAWSVVSQRSGGIAEGEKFGVEVGMPWKDADQALRSQFEPSYVLWERASPERNQRFPSVLCDGPVLKGPAEVTYRDDAGAIMLELRDGRVRKIFWRYPVRLATAL